jgi:TRAP-type mannitol/chloroaromatic compound transport system permease small subunit
MLDFAAKLTSFIDKCNTEICRWASWLVPASVVVVVLDVGVRYLIPKHVLIWPFDLSWMLFAFYFMLAAPYTLQVGGHVRLDFLLIYMPKRTRALIDFLYYLVFIMPIVIIIIIYGIPYAADSVMSGESWPGAWLPPVYEVKILIPVAFCLFLFQAVSEMIKCIKLFKEGGKGG